MPLSSQHLQQAFGDFAELFAAAQQNNVSIDPKAMPAILGAVAYYAISPTRGQPDEKARQQALNSWNSLLQQKKGQTIRLDDAWEWIKRWLPDPIQAERISIDISDWTDKLR